MRDDFTVFIVSHGRANKILTIEALRKCGYTGTIHIIIDDKDDQADLYRQKFGSMVVQFDKEEAARKTDSLGNFNDLRSVVFARNAAYDIAQDLGFKYFLVLDDDYRGFAFRADHQLKYAKRIETKRLDAVLDAMLQYYEQAKAIDILAIQQAGDFIGGEDQIIRGIRMKRKTMNFFLSCVDRRVWFTGLLNDDVNTYTLHGSRGRLFFSTYQMALEQQETQSQKGGLTDLYVHYGTYIKSFSTVMIHPSGVKISTTGDPRSPHYRIHHRTRWKNVTPMILDIQHKKVPSAKTT